MKSSIVGYRNRLEKFSQLRELTITGSDVVVKEECLLLNSYILPQKTVAESYLEKGKILM